MTLNGVMAVQGQTQTTVCVISPILLAFCAYYLKVDH